MIRPYTKVRRDAGRVKELPELKGMLELLALQIQRSVCSTSCRNIKVACCRRPRSFAVLNSRYTVTIECRTRRSDYSEGIDSGCSGSQVIKTRAGEAFGQDTPMTFCGLLLRRSLHSPCRPFPSYSSRLFRAHGPIHAVASSPLPALQRLRENPYVQLARLDKPIGSWLLYWPCGTF